MPMHTDTVDSRQRRARIGGELGVNGEWYEGGKFIATRDNPKQAPLPKRELTADDLARIEANREREQREIAWLNARKDQFRELTAPFLACPFQLSEARWNDQLSSGHADFNSSLAYQLMRDGSLSERQARYFVKAAIGRETKKNSVAWWAAFDSITERFDEKG